MVCLIYKKKLTTFELGKNKIHANLHVTQKLI